MAGAHCLLSLKTSAAQGAEQRPALKWLERQLVPYRIDTKYELSSADAWVAAPPRDALSIVSFDLPRSHTDWPTLGLYQRTFLYDLALAVIVFSMSGKFEEAGRLLLTLEHLQQRSGDGGVGFSWNCSGDGFYNVSYQRVGAMAYAGYAIVLHQRLSQDPDRRFLPVAERLAGYILRRQVADANDPRYGLVRGGFGFWAPDYSKLEMRPAEYCSLEHNVDAYFFLRDLYYETKVERYGVAANTIKRQLLKTLWSDKESRFFVAADPQGVNREKALDASSWGAIFLIAIGERARARRALEFVDKHFQSAVGDVRGYKPYAGQYSDHAVRDWNKMRVCWGKARWRGDRLAEVR